MKFSLRLNNDLPAKHYVAFAQALRSNAEVIISEDALASQDLFQ